MRGGIGRGCAIGVWGLHHYEVLLCCFDCRLFEYKGKVRNIMFSK